MDDLTPPGGGPRDPWATEPLWQHPGSVSAHPRSYRCKPWRWVAGARAVEPGRAPAAQAPERLVAVVDEARIRQVLANLLGNVREHTAPQTPVSVRLGQVGDRVLLEVADAGPGMAAAEAARAFDRFYRAPGDDGDGTTRRLGGGGGGSGLGLSIVQAIARAHGGQAVLDSRPGDGTRARIWLPLHIKPESTA